MVNLVALCTAAAVAALARSRPAVAGLLSLADLHGGGPLAAALTLRFDDQARLVAWPLPQGRQPYWRGRVTALRVEPAG